MRFSQELSRAVDRYTDARFNPVSPPTREEIDTLRAEVLRAAVLNIVGEGLDEIRDLRKELAMRERDLSRLKFALELVDPMVEVKDGQTDGRPEGGAAPR